MLARRNNLECILFFSFTLVNIWDAIHFSLTSIFIDLLFIHSRAFMYPELMFLTEIPFNVEVMLPTISGICLSWCSGKRGSTGNQ